MRYRCLKNLLLLCTTIIILPIAHARESLQISSSQGMVWVQASNVTARTLAEELSNRLDITVVLTGDADTRLDVDIAEEPLAKAVAKLSPNNLVVRESSDPNSEIIEVVLMMGDSAAPSGGDEQFLPTGSPGAEIVSGDYSNQTADIQDPINLRDPNRSILARQTAQAATQEASLPPDQVPPMFPQDMNNPASALPLDQQQ